MIQSVSLLLLIAAVVILTDLFYHYHAPAPGLKAVVNKAEYQCIGTIRNFKYDGLMLGSSMADLLYYLNDAYQNHELGYVFYNLDLFALSEGPQHHFIGKGMPLYLYNNNILDDIHYLFNKDVLFEYVPYQLAVSMQQDYDEGTSYNWAQYKTFSREDALLHYERPPVSEAAELGADEREVIEANVALLVQMAEAHPETEFYFFYPPYSLLWWDSVNREGRLAAYLYAAERAAEVLTVCENVHLYSFLAEEDIVCNLDFYMDSMHFSADINRWIVEQLGGNEYLLTKQNYEEELTQLKGLVERMIEYDIPAYFPEN